MSFLESLQNRYTTKKYDPTKKISESEINELKEIVRLSPSSINSQPWKFTFVSDEKIKAELAKASYFNDEKVLEASHVVVFSAIDDIAYFERQIEVNNPPRAVAYYEQFLKDKPEQELKMWFAHQVYLSLGVFLSACAEMGIDSTPMEGIVMEDYDTILKNENHKTLFAVAIGYRDKDDLNQPDKTPKSRLAIDDVIKVV